LHAIAHAVADSANTEYLISGLIRIYETPRAFIMPVFAIPLLDYSLSLNCATGDVGEFFVACHIESVGLLGKRATLSEQLKSALQDAAHAKQQGSLAEQAVNTFRRSLVSGDGSIPLVSADCRPTTDGRDR
jgi:hypothetical protein